MAGPGGTVTKYSKIWLSDFFHSFPHFNLSIESVNSTFDPTNSDYQQATVTWGGLPVALCALLWIVFIFYFIHKCCKSTPKQRGETGYHCSLFWAGILVLTAFGLLGYGFYQNEEAHRGVQDCRRSVRDINSTIASATQRIELLDGIASNVSTHISENLERVLMEVDNMTVRTRMGEIVSKIRTDANKVRGDIDGIHMGYSEINDALQTSADLEYFRWMTNILVFCVYIFILLMAFIGLITKKKCVLVIAVVLMAMCSIFIWGATGLYLAVSIALGDFCQDPDAYFLSLASTGSLSQGSLRAYIICDDTTQPYQNSIQDAMNSVSKAFTELNETIKLAKPFNIHGLDAPVAEMRSSLNFATGNLSTLLTNVGSCVELHQDYVQAVDDACVETLTATAFLTLMSCLIGLVCTLVIFTLPCTWSHFFKGGYEKVDMASQATHVFDLAHPPPEYGSMNPRNPQPWSERGPLQRSDAQGIRSNEPIVHVAHAHYPPRDDSPPPAYHPGGYIKQYAESGPSPGNVRSSTGN